ncbi:hypothetical protein NUH16_008666 [Penicillium rubens]|nr:hypothetical protein NUH16_008666 [Penicillium rubens]
MVLGRIIRSFGAEHLASMTPKKITVIFVLNDVLTFCTQLGGAGVQVTGDPDVMAIGKKVVLAGLIFSLAVFAFFIWIAATLQRRLEKTPTEISIMHNIHWRRYMLALYVAFVYHPGLLIKKARRVRKVADFHEPLTGENRVPDIELTRY